jgi:DNA-binding MarR family transcriptional regulator
MTYHSQELLALFGRLFQQRMFVSAAMRSSVDNDDHGHGNRGQLRLLQLLEDQDGLTNAEIAEKLDIRPSSVSALVKKLEEADFIERHESASDKRVSQIFLTEDGRQFIHGTRAFKDEFSESCFASLSADEQAQLRDLLTKLIGGLENDWNGPKAPEEWQALMRRHGDHHRKFDRFQGYPFGGPFHR